MRRFAEPKLFVKTPLGIFPSVNWSTSGICISHIGEERFEVDDILNAHLVAENYPPPREAIFEVIKDDQARGVVLLKFASMGDDLEKYLNSLVADIVAP